MVIRKYSEDDTLTPPQPKAIKRYSLLSWDFLKYFTLSLNVHC